MGGAHRVPTKDSIFDTYLRDTTVVLETGTPTGAVRLGLNAAQSAQWISYRDQWVIIYPQYTNSATRTSTITEAKNSLKAEFALFAENPLKLIEASDNLTSDDRGTFRLPKRDRSPTSRGVITDIPFGKLQGTGGGILEVRVRRTNDATRSSMHPLADAVEFRYKITDSSNGGQNPAPPTDPNMPPVPRDESQVPTPNDCPLSVNSKKSLLRINLGPSSQSKRVIGFVRWINLSHPENNSGWSDLMTTLIS